MRLGGMGACQDPLLGQVKQDQEHEQETQHLEAHALALFEMRLRRQ